MKFVFFFALLLITHTYFAQTSFNKQNSNNKLLYSENRGDYRIMFYNCENLFDTFDDTLKSDEEFLPQGAKYWTYSRYYKKLTNISKVITAVGGWEPPELIGLCEVENLNVLDDLLLKTGLKKYKYGIVHKESEDARGVDVAFLYLKEKFYPLSYEPIRIFYKDGTPKKTRNILYVSGTISNQDTLHIFVNHWPSRLGGAIESEPERMLVAEILKAKTDSVFNKQPNANILILGDLNDYPNNKSLTEFLKTQNQYTIIRNNQLYNLSYYLQFDKKMWSHRNQGEGGILDQIIVSGALLNHDNNIFTTKENTYIFDAPFLLEPDENNFGNKPFRTYIGYKYNGGFSDHLPVFLDLFLKK